MLVTSIFSFSYNVFKGFFPRVIKKSGLCGKKLRHVVQKTILKKAYENIVRKQENVV